MEVIIYILMGILWFVFFIGTALVGLIEWLEEIFENIFRKW